MARRTRRGDPLVKTVKQLEEEATKIDEFIVTLVKTELQGNAQDMSSNRMQYQQPTASADFASCNNGELAMIMGSLFSRQNAAADALTRRSEEITGQLSRQQKKFMNRTEQLSFVF